MKSSGILAGIIIFLCVQNGGSLIHAQEIFTAKFRESSIRVDLVLAGDHQHTEIYLDEIRREPYWGGTRKHMVDPFEYGEYRFELWDTDGKELIFSRGFGTLFEEWQTIPEARNVKRAFQQVIVFPEPRRKAILKVHERDSMNVFHEQFSLRIDPDDPAIKMGMNTDFPSQKLVDHGPAGESLDIVFLAEGYTASRISDFYEDVTRFSDYFFRFEPFRDRQSSVNIWAVAAESEEPGADQSGNTVWRNTVMNANYFTFGSERYLTTNDIKSVRDIAGQVPYDVICILVNSEKYGGGGIYNHYAMGASKSRNAEAVMLHEVGHALAGLGDEYYSSDVAYENFYRLDLEPWEPNLTTLVDFESKWAGLLHDGLPVPTPGHSDYDCVTGVFEGGGYASEGIYRPALDCRMKSNTAPEFCKICQQAIREMIDYYCGED